MKTGMRLTAQTLLTLIGFLPLEIRVRKSCWKGSFSTKRYLHYLIKAELPNPFMCKVILTRVIVLMELVFTFSKSLRAVDASLLTDDIILRSR